MEIKLCIDNVLRARTIGIPRELIYDVQSALTAMVALVVVTLIVGCITRVWRSGPTPFVALLQVHLRAVGTAPLASVGIAIEVVISLLEVATSVFARHRYRVEGVKAATLMLAHVHVPFYRATEKVWRIEVGVARVEGSIIDNVAAVVHVADEASTTR